MERNTVSSSKETNPVDTASGNGLSPGFPDEIWSNIFKIVSPNYSGQKLEKYQWIAKSQLNCVSLQFRRIVDPDFSYSLFAQTLNCVPRRGPFPDPFRCELVNGNVIRIISEEEAPSLWERTWNLVTSPFQNERIVEFFKITTDHAIYDLGSIQDETIRVLSNFDYDPDETFRLMHNLELNQHRIRYVIYNLEFNQDAIDKNEIDAKQQSAARAAIAYRNKQLRQKIAKIVERARGEIRLGGAFLAGAYLLTTIFVDRANR